MNSQDICLSEFLPGSPGTLPTGLESSPTLFIWEFCSLFFGLLLSVFFVNDTRVFTHQENKTSPGKALGNIFWETTLKNKTLSTVTQAGLVNNLNDGMIWGLLPILLFQYRLNIADIGLITATYPVVWGIGQLFTGKMSDHYSKKIHAVLGYDASGELPF
jgi:hypothetical protein